MGQKIDRECPVCMNNYKADTTRLKHGRETTCSKDCSYKRRASLIYKSHEITCPICSTKRIVAPSQIAKKGPTYCSLQCRGEGQTQGLTHRRASIYTPEGKERQRTNGRVQIQKALAALKKTNYACSKTPERRAASSKMMSERIREGKISRTSKLEKIVEQELHNRNIEYNPQYTLRGNNGRFLACIDFFLPEYNCALEVNGTYWHADPRFYNHDSLSKSQKRTQDFYKRKVKLLDELGIHLVELWEHEIIKGIFDFNF